MSLWQKFFKFSSHLKEGKQCKAVYHNHYILIGEPKNLGETDRVMNPIELLGSIGACKCIVAHAYAPFHNIDFQDIKVDVEEDSDLMDIWLKAKKQKLASLKLDRNLHLI